MRRLSNASRKLRSRIGFRWSVSNVMLLEGLLSPSSERLPTLLLDDELVVPIMPHVHGAGWRNMQGRERD